MHTQQLEVHGDEYRLKTRYDTDEYERENHELKKATGKGFIRDDNGSLTGRLVARIPVQDEQWLEANYDLDWLDFKHNNSKTALHRLLKRFPYWQVAEGSV